MILPSIFNDVIGPVMRGPSSSHCAASVRIGRLARDLMGGDIRQVTVQFDPQGSLATTHTSQGSDMGLFGGLLGWEAWDDRLVGSARGLGEAGIDVCFEICDYGAQHPNTYKLLLLGTHRRHEMMAISRGGGMVEVISIDGVPVSICGGYYETLIYTPGSSQAVAEYVADRFQFDYLETHQPSGSGGDSQGQIIEIKAQSHLPKELRDELQARFAVGEICCLSPVLPVLSRRDLAVPFLTAQEMLVAASSRSAPLWELALEYETCRGQLSRSQVLEMMEQIVERLQASILQGLGGTSYADRILGYQSGRFAQLSKQGSLLDGGMLNQMIASVTALMEVKSAMGVIVAAPTAGACGGMPGACLGAARALGLSKRDTARAMLAGGLIGVFIAARSTFAAEVCGCQVECGAGSGMAAAALVSLAGGTTQQALAAASMALQNILGLICDPVAGRVEVPCLGRNVLAASNALACANMALADYDAVIPLDEVIATMDAVGRSLPRELRCTALGGLAITPTSREIERKLDAARLSD